MSTTPEQLMDILESPRCYCGAPKRMQQPFCYNCFRAIPPASREFVRYIRNLNFRGTYDAALDYLRKHRYVNQSPV